MHKKVVPLDAGDILTYVALLTSFGALLLYILGARTDTRGRRGVPNPWTRAATVLSGLTLMFTLLVWALLTHYFMTNNMDIEYVHQHTSDTVDLGYKISGVWAGKVGSFLLWVVGMQAGLLGARALFSRWGRGREVRTLLDATAMIGAFMVLLFIIALVAMDPFRTTDPVALIEDPDGLGLNILLRHPYMALHPLLALFGYGVAMVPFVSSLTFLLTGNDLWARYSLPFSRLFFVMFSVALTMGGLWAYTTLGWGGYWGWDPVETSSLLPWMMAAVVCHTQVAFVKGRRSPLLGAMASYYLLPVILFATFAARSGLWTSVHSYASTGGDFWDVVASSGLLTGLLGIALSLSIIGPMLLARTYLSCEARVPATAIQEPPRHLWLTDRSNAQLSGNILILMGLTVTIFIMMFTIGSVLDPVEFEAKLAPLALILVGGLIMYTFGIRKAGRLPFIALGVAVASGLVAMALLPDRPLGAFATPFLTVAVVGLVYYMGRAPRAKRWRVRLHDTGAPIIHLGIVLLLLGYSCSTFFTHEETVNLSEDVAVEFEGYELVLLYEEESEDHLELVIEVRQDGRTLGLARPGYTYIDGHKRYDISVVRLLDKDLYFVYEVDLDTEEGLRAQVTVKSLPGMNLLWGGAFMVATGTILRFSYPGPSRAKAGGGRSRWRHTVDEEE